MDLDPGLAIIRSIGIVTGRMKNMIYTPDNVHVPQQAWIPIRDFR